MKSFDIITAIGSSYQKTGQEYHYLLKLAFVPFLVKSISLFFALQFLEPTDILRLSFFMLPAYFVEGWMLAHWVRTILIDHHRWPFVPSGDIKQDTAEIQRRGRGIMAGTLGFVVVNFLMAGFFKLAFTLVPPDLDASQADPMFGIYALMVLISIFLLFRFTWIYVPLAANISIVAYAKLSQPVLFTFSLIGVWLVCFIPPVMLMQVIAGIGSGISGGEQAGTASDFFLAFVRVFFDTLKNILVTAGIAFALKQLMINPK